MLAGETNMATFNRVLGENAAAVLGLVIALTALVLAQVTGDARYDAAGTLLVGAVLIGFAVFLAVEIKSLLAGESADPRIAAALHDEVGSDGRFEGVLNIVTIQQGPGEVLVAAKVRLDESLDGRGVVAAIDELERRLQARCSEIRWLFIEPDDAEPESQEGAQADAERTTRRPM